MKNAITKKNETYITVTPVGEHMERAAKVNYYHNVGRQCAALALEAAFRCGMELFQAKIEHAGTLEQWIEENCEFGRAMAYRYLSLVQKAIGADDLPKLANGSEKQRKSAIAEILSESDSKSVTELFCEYGVMKKTPSNLGGKRDGAGRPKKDNAEELAKAADAISQGLNRDVILETVSQLYVLTVTNDGFGDLETEALRNEIEMLEKMTARAKTILKSRKDK